MDALLDPHGGESGAFGLPRLRSSGCRQRACYSAVPTPVSVPSFAALRPSPCPLQTRRATAAALADVGCSAVL